MWSVYNVILVCVIAVIDGDCCPTDLCFSVCIGGGLPGVELACDSFLETVLSIYLYSYEPGAVLGFT